MEKVDKENTVLPLDIAVKIDGMERIRQLSNDLQQSVEKTKALAGALVQACDELSISLDHEAVAQAAVKAIDDSVQAHRKSLCLKHQ